MIVISRLAGEAIVVGHELTVTVVSVDGDEVLLQIEGPDEISLERGEELVSITNASPRIDY